MGAARVAEAECGRCGKVRKLAARGLCNGCYVYLWKWVKSGKGSWVGLEEGGRCVAVRGGRGEEELRGERGAGYELTKRILGLMEREPRVVEISDPWELFKVPGFKCDDLEPTVAEASAALGEARELYVSLKRVIEEERVGK